MLDELWDALKNNGIVKFVLNLRKTDKRISTQEQTEILERSITTTIRETKTTTIRKSE